MAAQLKRDCSNIFVVENYDVPTYGRENRVVDFYDSISNIV